MENVKVIQKGDWSAVINLSRGANCMSLRNKRYGAKILREPQADWVPDNPFTYGMPLLFPVNRIEGGEFEFEGRRYVFHINEPKTNCHLHGELHKTPFQLKSLSESRIVCSFSATEERPYLSFPHAFDVELEYELKGEGLFQRVTVTNHSRENMPLFLGFHTTFNTLFLESSRPENIRACVGISEEYERLLGVNYLPTGKKPPFDEVSLALSRGEYRPMRSKTSRHYRAAGNMSLTDIGAGLRLVYENDERYAFRLIYNGGEDGYICLEPQTCLANCQNSPFSREEAGFDYVCPGQSKTFNSRIYLEEI